MGKLFGTDGIRGTANDYPMTPEMAVDIGRAIAAGFFDGKKTRIVVGKDTRISGYMLEHALVSGICSMGGDVYAVGTLPTPGVAFMTSSTGANAGIVVTASHNPFYDNGIKIFDGNGYKLSDEKEAEIEKCVLEGRLSSVCKSLKETGKVFTLDDSETRYADFLKQALPVSYSLKGLKIVLDCANGATYNVAPRVFADFNAEVESLFVNPDGKNINHGCGSEHIEILRGRVLESRADIGLAFDGDGDRLIAVDESGGILTGDQILIVCARFMKKGGALKNNRVVSTIMSNMGLGVALRGLDISHGMSQVGDRHVMEEMVASGAVIGGEDSGHMIFLDHHTTGDGILTALKLIEVMIRESSSLSQLAKVMTVFPQVLINVEVKRTPEIKTVQKIAETIRLVEQRLGEEGRVLVRYSGTQPLCRVMVESPHPEETDRFCRQIADVVKTELG